MFSLPGRSSYTVTCQEAKDIPLISGFSQSTKQLLRWSMKIGSQNYVPKKLDGPILPYFTLWLFNIAMENGP